MKFDQKTIFTLLIGIVIGGVGIGLIDANRPKPLFSSANMSEEIGQQDKLTKSEAKRIEVFFSELQTDMAVILQEYKIDTSVESSISRLSVQQKQIALDKFEQSYFENKYLIDGIQIDEKDFSLFENPAFIPIAHAQLSNIDCEQLGELYMMVSAMATTGYMPKRQANQIIAFLNLITILIDEEDCEGFPPLIT